jgi:nucleotide-binding universal stress UspA family protein
MFGNILCAVDGSPHALGAARLASELALAGGGKLTFLTVSKRFKLTESVKQYLEIENLGTSEPQYVLDEFTKKVLAQARDIAREVGADAEAEAREGQPARIIVDYAAELGADVIVTGSRGYGDIEGTLLGSVSHKVTSLAKCTVITVK